MHNPKEHNGKIPLLLLVTALAIALLLVLIGPGAGAADGDTNFTNVVTSGDITAGDDLTVTDDVTVSGSPGRRRQHRRSSNKSYRSPIASGNTTIAST